MKLVVPARAVVLALICILLDSCRNPQASGPAPSVEFTNVPPAGLPGRRKLDSIEGRVIAARSGERIILYAKGEALWWVQPFANAPFTAVQPNSTWRNSTHLGTEYAALLVKPGYKPPSITEPLGVKVTIIEPGGFRTDFAGSSTQLREGRPEYDATVGATVRFQRSYDGKQPGDPAKAAAALLHIASLSDPPLRLLLGSDSYNAAEQSALQKLELDRKWKDLSVSTDYSADGLSPSCANPPL